MPLAIAMALSYFSLNPSTTTTSSSSSSCNFIKTHSQSLYLLLLQPKPHSSATSRAFNFRISCSQQRVDTQQQPQRVKLAFENTNPRKKRKPRPSFLDQIRDKWSTKLTSQRQKFPWQEQEEEEAKEIPQEQHSDGSEIEASFSDSVSFVLPSSVISAPWAHGAKPFEPQVEPQPKTSPTADGFGRINDNGVTKPSSGFQSKSDKVSMEKRVVSVKVNGFSLNETPSGNKDNVDLVGSTSGYDSGDSEFELGEGEKVRRNSWSNTAMAEKMLPEHELKRLRNVSLRMMERKKVGAAGITQALVDAIHEKWKLDEVVKLKFEEPLSLNMRRTHAILEVGFWYIVAFVIDCFLRLVIVPC